MLQFPSHGANYEELYKNFGIQLPENIVDLSENINYLGAPQQVIKQWPALLQKIYSYPNPNAEPLRTGIANKHNVALDNVIVGNGGAELLTFYAQLYKGKKVVLVHPTFSEYKLTLEAAGAEVIDLVVENVLDYQLPIRDIKQAMEEAACFYLCNPNNPTGALIPKETLVELIEHGIRVGCSILVDEAFMDWTSEEHSLIHDIPKFPNLTVLRSMTKMYGIAGIRLGYLVSNPLLISMLQMRLPHWNVNNLAIAIGSICLNDEEFRIRSIESINEVKNDMFRFLEEYQCSVTESEANFLCFQLKNPKETRDFYFFSLQKGVVLRHTENYLGMNGEWIRIGVKQKEAMKKFKIVLGEWYG